MTSPTLAFIGLGSNLDNPERQIQSALTALSNVPESYGLKCAPWYQSAAIGPGEQADYINTVVSLTTQLPPLELLRAIQEIEDQHGRQRQIRWGARTLDLDLLLYGNVCHQHQDLIIPHPEMRNRAFVLAPLYDLAPKLIFPNGEHIKDLLAQSDPSDLRKLS